MAADSQFQEALKSLVAALSEIEALSMIIGGIAVIAAGVPRETIDIDATVLGRDCQVEDLVRVLARHAITPRIGDAIAFAKERQVLLLRHDPSGVTIEISFAWLPFEEEALESAVETDLAGLRVRLARPEDLIVYKAAAWRDRDLADIERLLVLHLEGIDLPRVRNLVREIAAALGDESRVAKFETLVRKAEETR